MGSATPRSLRRAYVDWVEEQIEEFKERIPRSQLLAMADEVVTELRMDGGGQYQLTEILLCNAMDRRIFRMLKLPGYRAWCAQHTARPEVISFPLPDRFVSAPVVTPAPRAVMVAAEHDETREPLACVG
ncbi:hypothetical protein [Longimicrobium sp.]|uniref:hypothetical protein n=1 Tax=Longimicrobium sp. TaxID=2029185 RepID=UPI002E35E7B3|nr:hypothetical protein [Longimicrobium sp.]HEX6039804.1 hypothetical protein [Longimicrobium sp.]